MAANQMLVRFYFCKDFHIPIRRSLKLFETRKEKEEKNVQRHATENLCFIFLFISSTNV